MTKVWVVYGYDYDWKEPYVSGVYTTHKAALHEISRLKGNKDRNVSAKLAGRDLEGEKDNNPITLKPCPFCGSDEVHTYSPSPYEIGNDASVNCENPVCGAEVRGSVLKEAIAKWNRRVSE